MKKISVGIDLQHTLDSGQLFRYQKEGEGYRITHKDNSFFVKQKEHQLFFDRITKSKLTRFFRLDDNYKKIIQDISQDKTVKKAVQKYHGMRIMNQDPWECTISFVCSSATNIPRIKRDLNNISQKFGQKKDKHFLFPKIGEIDNLKKIKECGTGYRAKYIYQINNIVTKTFFKKLSNLSYHDVKQKLVELPGIGPKIADCILLFSCNHLNAFPIDVWMKRILHEHYSQEKENYDYLLNFSQNYFGKYAGYAQQFLYHWKRNQKS